MDASFAVVQTEDEIVGDNHGGGWSTHRRQVFHFDIGPRASR